MSEVERTIKKVFGLEGQDVNLQPGILMHRVVDHRKATSYTQCSIKSNEEKIRELIKEGWISFHIQTEFRGNSHVTYVYFVMFPKE